MSKCGCTSYRKYGVHDKIEYCPLHAAAPELAELVRGLLGEDAMHPVMGDLLRDKARRILTTLKGSSL